MFQVQVTNHHRFSRKFEAIFLNEIWLTQTLEFAVSTDQLFTTFQ